MKLKERLLNQKWLDRAKKVVPSASQTYSKSYRYYSEGAAPVFLEKGHGAYVWSVDGKKYVDMVLGLGAITIGYADRRINRAVQKQLRKGSTFTLANTLEVLLAVKLVQIIPCAEMVRFAKNGSDATTAAVRLARAYTGRDLIMSCGYHGWHDWSIGKSENNLGVPQDVQKLTLSFQYNDLKGFERLLNANKGKVAAVVMEPVQLEMPKPGFLEAIRRITSQHGIVLIFDEVVTGFRFSLGGGQEYFNVKPDLACFGKGMANGFPISALVGRADMMKLIDQRVFVSMTFGGDCLSLAAALETIRILEQPESFRHLWKIEHQLICGVNSIIKKYGLSELIYTAQFPCHTAILFRDLGHKISSLHLQSFFQEKMIEKHVLFLGIQNLSLAHTKREIDFVLKACDYACRQVRKEIDKKKVRIILKGRGIRPIFQRN